MIWVLAIYSIMLSIICAKLADSLFKAKQVDKAQEELIKNQQHKIHLLEQMNADLENECDMLSDMVEGTILTKVKAAFGDFSVQAEGNTVTDALVNLFKLRDESKKAFAENLDPRDKEVGDRVKLWNFWLAKQADKKSDFNDTEYSEIEAVVIQKDLKIVIKDDILGKEHVLDTAIEYPDKTIVYTTSQYIKRTDNFEK